MLASAGMKWPKEFYELRRGEGCPMCAQGRPEETEYGIRFFAGEVADAYLQRAKIQRGYIARRLAWTPCGRADRAIP